MIGIASIESDERTLCTVIVFPARSTKRFQYAQTPTSSPPPLPSSHLKCGGMGTPLLTQVFRRLLSHHTCSTLRYHQPASGRLSASGNGQKRSYKSRRKDRQNSEDKALSNWQQRTSIFPPNKLQEYERAPLVTANALRGRRERPRRVKMLTRDFIEGLRRCPLFR